MNFKGVEARKGRLHGISWPILGFTTCQGHEILSRHHSMSHVFAEARVAGKLQNGLGKLLLDDFRNQFSQVGARSIGSRRAA